MKGLPFLAIFSSLALVAATWRIRVSQLVGMAKSSTFPPFTTCVIQKKPDFDPIEHLLKTFFSYQLILQGVKSSPVDPPSLDPQSNLSVPGSSCEQPFWQVQVQNFVFSITKISAPKYYSDFVTLSCDGVL